MTEKHARAFDLPGWPCPPRVRDILDHEESWGWVSVSDIQYNRVPFSDVVQDELGFLWVDGDAIPRFHIPSQHDDITGALTVWTDQGIGLWMPPSSFRYIGNISLLDMEPDRWIPIAVALAELPAFVKGAE